MKIPVESTLRQEVDITEIAVSILKVMVKPYNDLLEQMLKDGRVTEAELGRLHNQFLERGDRFDELLKEEMARRTGAGDARGAGGGAGAGSGSGDASGGGRSGVDHIDLIK